MIESVKFSRNTIGYIDEYTNFPVQGFTTQRCPNGASTLTINGKEFHEGDIIVFVDGIPKYENEVELNVVLQCDYEGDWQRLIINNVMVEGNHSVDVMYHIENYVNGYKGRVTVSFREVEDVLKY